MTDVSIIIPVYNRVELLKQAILSCAIQTFEDCEVLIVDDGSEEDVSLVLERMRDTLGGSCLFRLIRQTRQGAPAARNRGVREAAGRFIQFLDSDDLLHPQKIEIQRKCLLNRPELDMVFGLDEFFHRLPGDMGILWNTPGEPSLDRFLWEDTVWHTGSPLWRRSALERVGCWDERLICYQDWEYHIRALCRGIRYDHVPVVLQYIREHEASRISTSSSLKGREHAKIEAAVSAAQELMKQSVWSKPRGNALAVFLLYSTLTVRRIETLRFLMATLAKAARYAGSLRLRLAALGMLCAAALTSAKRGGNRDTLESVFELANRLGGIPFHESNWKRAACDPGKVPASLLQALKTGSEDGRTACETSNGCPEPHLYLESQ